MGINNLILNMGSYDGLGKESKNKKFKTLKTAVSYNRPACFCCLQSPKIKAAGSACPAFVDSVIGAARQQIITTQENSK